MSVRQPDICNVASRNTSQGQGAHSVKEHIKQCNVRLCDDDVIVLGCNNREDHLFTLEAIFQHEIRPKINGKEEFKTKTLSIIF